MRVVRRLVVGLAMVVLVAFVGILFLGSPPVRARAGGPQSPRVVAALERLKAQLPWLTIALPSGAAWATGRVADKAASAARMKALAGGYR